MARILVADDEPGLREFIANGIFPMNGIAWEINYRGELEFWHQAMAQKESRNLFIEDGWLYFVHGWTQFVAEVLHIQLYVPLFRRLEIVAGSVRLSP